MNVSGSWFKIMVDNRRLSGVWRWFVVLCLVFPGAQPAHGAPEAVSLVTRDGVQLRITYFPSTRRAGTAEAKQVTPVILLHDHKATRAGFNSLAQRLQAVGDTQRRPAANNPQTAAAFAVLSVDLRAHGESTRQQLPNGQQLTLDATKLTRPGLLAITLYDMEAVRSFLIGKNDAGELNLNKLCIVGAGMGANIAANWALHDWSAPPLAVGKQGQDVKALVLISPKWSFTGLSFQAPMKSRLLKQNLAWMIAYGEQDAKAKADVERIEKQLERYHPKVQPGAGQTSSALQVVGWKSKLQSGTLLTQSGAPLEDKIIEFLVEHVAKESHPWSSRLDRVPR
jgi:pimeloyl-ACP methyl ester carboxylesterase